MTDQHRERAEAEHRRSTDPVGTTFGAAFGPFRAVLGSAVAANRAAFGFAFAFGTGSPAREESADGLEDAATVEITEPGADDAGEG